MAAQEKIMTKNSFQSENVKISCLTELSDANTLLYLRSLTSAFHQSVIQLYG